MARHALEDLDPAFAARSAAGRRDRRGPELGLRQQPRAGSDVLACRGSPGYHCAKFRTDLLSQRRQQRPPAHRLPGGGCGHPARRGCDRRPGTMRRALLRGASVAGVPLPAALAIGRCHPPGRWAAAHAAAALRRARSTRHHGDCEMTTICLIPGDGVGREVVPAAAQAIATALPSVRFVHAQAGWDCFDRTGTRCPRKPCGRHGGRCHAVRRHPVADDRRGRRPLERRQAGRLPQPDPRAAQAVRPLRQPAARRAARARQPAHRPADRPREHRGPVQRPRAARGRHGHRRARDHPPRQRAHRARSPSSRPGAAPRCARVPGPLRKGDHRPQGQRPEADRRPVPRELPRRRARSTPTSRSTRCWSTRPRCGWCRTRPAST